MTGIETGFGAAPLGATEPEAAEFASLMPAEATLVAGVGEDDDFRACRDLIGHARRDYGQAQENMRLALQYKDMGQDRVAQSYADKAYAKLQELLWTLEELLGNCVKIGALSDAEIREMQDIKARVDGLLRRFESDQPTLGERAGAFLQDAGEVMGQIGQGLAWAAGAVLGGLGWLLGGGRQGAF
ncbi:hypothetical protein [Futiania mangrovi]|uniref:Uncharacterized protein n=1 Tax=Futiania mangrovi TaxID=2959716 RepID=A0A9J6PDC6_9PROT|nr:hypothetical protein [Futiania mangrovii]MCP1336617.1 hypothetical protein [Futiania mangrovii]